MALQQPVSEDDFRRYVIQMAKDHAYHVSHIESHLTSAGIPDLSLWKGMWPDGRDLPVELKIIKNGIVKMRPTQRRWHRERHEKGGASWVFVLDPKTQDVLWLRGHVAAGLEPPAGAWRPVSNVVRLPALFTVLNRLSYGDAP